MEIKNVTVRMPADLHAKLVVLSEQEKRSMNSQILAVLENATKDIKDIKVDARADKQEATS